MYYTCLFSLTFRGHRGQSQKIELVPLSPWKSFQIQNRTICHVFLVGVPMTLTIEALRSKTTQVTFCDF